MSETTATAFIFLEEQQTCEKCGKPLEGKDRISECEDIGTLETPITGWINGRYECTACGHKGEVE